MSDAAPVQRWEGRSVEEWRTLWGVPRLLILDRVSSTNDVARELVDQGAPSGTTVLAEHQTRGRGQRGREWQAPPGRALLLSMVLRTRAGAAPGVLPVRVGLAVARALERCGIEAFLKWPNDIVAGGGKLGGILCEASFAGDELAAVVGIGLNVLQRADELPTGIEPPPVSAAMLGSDAGRAEIAGAVTAAVAALGPAPAAPLSAAELRDFAARDILRDRAVAVDGAPAGTARGLAADGALLLDGPAGRREIRAGTVRPADGSYGPPGDAPGSALDSRLTARP